MNGLGFKVTDTREIQQMTQAGNTMIAYRVWIVTDRGSTGSVDVSQANWTPELLAPILAEKAQALDLAFALTSP